MTNLAAFTELGCTWPAYISVNQEDDGTGKVKITVRGQPCAPEMTWEEDGVHCNLSAWKEGKQTMIEMSREDFRVFAARIAEWWYEQWESK